MKDLGTSKLMGDNKRQRIESMSESGKVSTDDVDIQTLQWEFEPVTVVLPLQLDAKEFEYLLVKSQAE
jgi:hypothetical protein